MAEYNEKEVRIRNVIDTEQNWLLYNPVLLRGEIGFAIKTGNQIAYKIGDGNTAWANLPYSINTASEITAMVTNLQNQIDAIVTTSASGGDVAAEVAQSRVGADGTAYQTLKQRLDAEYNALAAEQTNLKEDLTKAITEISDGYLTDVGYYKNVDTLVAHFDVVSDVASGGSVYELVDIVAGKTYEFNISFTSSTLTQLRLYTSNGTTVVDTIGTYTNGISSGDELRVRFTASANAMNIRLRIYHGGEEQIFTIDITDMDIRPKVYHLNSEEDLMELREDLMELREDFSKITFTEVSDKVLFDAEKTSTVASGGSDYFLMSEAFEAGKEYKIEINFIQSTLTQLRIYTTTDTTVDDTIGTYTSGIATGDYLSVSFTATKSAEFVRLRIYHDGTPQKYILKVSGEDEKTIKFRGELPAYINNEVNKVKTDILHNADLDSIIFGVYTDIHFPTDSTIDNDVNNQKWKSIKALNKIANEAPLDFVIQGGDLLTYGNYDGDTYTLNRSQYEFSNCRIPLFTAKGDHDSAQRDTSISVTDFASKTRPYMPINVVYSTYTPNDYYYDIPYKKVRFICLDTGSSESGISSENVKKHLEWLCNDVFTDEVKNGWRFVVWSHCPIDYEWNIGRCRKAIQEGTGSQYVKAYPVILDLLEALNNNQIFNCNHTQETRTVYFNDNGTLVSQEESTTSMQMLFNWGISSTVSKDFTGWTSKVRMVSSGHCHCDRLNNNSNGGKSTLGIAYTGSANCTGYKTDSEYHYYHEIFGEDGVNAKWLNLQNRTYGTISEDLMDVFIINNNDIKRVRFGCGDSETPSYLEI